MSYLLCHGWNGRTAICTAIVLLCGAAAAFSQDAAPPFPNADPGNTPPATPAEDTVTEGTVATAQVSAEVLTSLLAKVEAATDQELTAEQKERARTLVGKAQEDLRVIGTLAEQEKQFAEKIAGVTSRRREIEQQQQQERRVESPWSGASLEYLERTLAEKQQQLAKTQSDLTSIESRISSRDERKRQLHELIAAAPKKLTDIATSTQNPENQKEPALLQDAIRLSLLAEKLRVEKEPTVAQSELAWYDAAEAVKLLASERTIVAREVSILKQEVDAWTKAVSTRSKQDAATRAANARKKAEETKPPLDAIYLQAASYSDNEVKIRNERSEYQEDLDSARVQREKLERDFKGFQEREKRSRESVILGLRLRDQRRRLPSVGSLRIERRERVDVMERIQGEYFDYLEQETEAPTLDERVTTLMSEMASPVDEDEDNGLVETDIREALSDENVSHEGMMKAYSEYVDTLEQLDIEQGRLIELALEFEEYINERVLWIRSHRPISWTGLTSDIEAATRLVDRSTWQELGSSITKDAYQTPWAYLLAVAIWLGLAATQVIQRNALKKHGAKAQSRLNTEMRPTWQALLWTLLLTLLIPLPILFLGWRLRFCAAEYVSTAPGVLHEQHWMEILADWLSLFGGAFLVLEFACNVCQVQGLGESHFGWSKRTMVLVVKEVRRFEFFAVPLVMFLSLLHALGTDSTEEALEQLTAIASFLLLAWLLHRLVRPSKGIQQEWTEWYPKSWLAQLSILIYVLAVGIPLVLAGLSAAGYHFTSGRLALRMGETLMLVFGSVFVRAIVVRGLTLRQRQLAVEQARERRAAAASKAAEGEVPKAAAPATSPTDLATMSVQTRRLLDSTVMLVTLVALWSIWGDVLPALKGFNRWTIPGLPVTYSAAGLAILVGMLTGTAAKNIPGLLELLLLERLPLDRSSRYAIASIVRYVIVLVGVLSVSEILEIRWESIQWLAAALTFGLGFGLQEIFANFVSGLIILFEQPVRIGDVVTIDGVSGTVSQISIRSTTITDWDKKEYVVPNKEFITGRLLNWTLNDTLNRITVTVGVAYGCDPASVREILMTVVKEQPHVLAEPEPVIIFEGFGDSSLNFTIHVYLAALEHRLPTKTGLHIEIYKALNEAGIEIPFPQRDIHIRTVPSELDQLFKSPTLDLEEPSPTSASDSEQQ
ncbi:MAG: mechanosensitive ion channel [Planctomycetaceae bacterium]|nr:mechanosensitive ion channel [Planctomycetaceae bacterium]